jgi:hypothetical protein
MGGSESRKSFDQLHQGEARKMWIVASTRDSGLVWVNQPDSRSLYPSAQRVACLLVVAEEELTASI